MRTTLYSDDPRWKDIVEMGQAEILTSEVDPDTGKMEVTMLIRVDGGENQGLWLVGEYNGEEFWMSCTENEYEFMLNNEPPLTKAKAIPVTTYTYEIDEEA